ncbi:MAG: serine/threonine-protein kinase, partial [Anaerolineae bacterium]|nr:serine/threonine-protein kinase [Anaerolineae bacterium]
MMTARNLVGQTLGQYELQELLGRGGMADVYLGYQANLKRHVAVKVLAINRVGEEGYVTRFIREAEIAASLEHPHIVPIIDFGTQPNINVNYVVMRLLRGGSLAERMRQRRANDETLSMGETETLLSQIAGALDYAHKRNIVHRDIKPSNIMFDTQGTAFLVDFGIAKPLDVVQQMTVPGTSMGTAAYMAPEQWRGDKLTGAVDQYAMGLIIYRLVTGQPAFEVPSDAPYALMHKHIEEMPTPAHEVNPDLPEAVSEAVVRAVAKKPEDRYPTVTAFSHAFSKAIEGIEGKGRSTGFFTFQLPAKPGLDAAPRTPTPPAGRSAIQPPRLGGERETRPPGRGSQRLIVGALALALIAVAIVAILLILRNGEQGTQATALEQTQAALNPTLTAIAIARGEDMQPSAIPTRFGGGSGILAYGSNRSGVWQIFLTQVGSGVETAITAEGADNFMPRWSPDGQSIAFVSDRDGQAEIYRMSSRGARQERLTTSAGGLSEWPRWSPEGGRIVYEAQRDGNRDIFVMNADGSDPANVSNDPADDRQPSWSPDGEQIAFASDRTGDWRIYVMNADGSGVRQLTDGEGQVNREPLWSPDGRFILFRSEQEGASDLYLIAPDGSDLRQLTTLGRCYGPSWSPDGGEVAFHTTSERGAQILIVQVDGGALTAVTETNTW